MITYLKNESSVVKANDHNKSILVIFKHGNTSMVRYDEGIYPYGDAVIVKKEEGFYVDATEAEFNIEYRFMQNRFSQV
jgi:hypothetical protein